MLYPLFIKAIKLDVISSTISKSVPDLPVNLRSPLKMKNWSSPWAVPEWETEIIRLPSCDQIYKIKCKKCFIEALHRNLVARCLNKFLKFKNATLALRFVIFFVSPLSLPSPTKKNHKKFAGLRTSQGCYHFSNIVNNNKLFSNKKLKQSMTLQKKKNNRTRLHILFHFFSEAKSYWLSTFDQKHYLQWRRRGVKR